MGCNIPNCRLAFDVFLMKQFSENIPDELLEATKIDGAEKYAHSSDRAAANKPRHWSACYIYLYKRLNDYFLQLIMLNSTEVLTISLGIAKLQAELSTDFGLIMAGLRLLPCLLL